MRVLLAATFIAVGAAAVVGILVWEPWAGDDDGGQAMSPTPTTEATPDDEGITAEEAALAAQAWSRERIVDSVLCVSAKLDIDTDSWIASCTFETLGISLTGDPPNPQTCTFELAVSPSDAVVRIIETQPNNAAAPLWVCESLGEGQTPAGE